MGQKLLVHDVIIDCGSRHRVVELLEAIKEGALLVIGN